jgi:glutaredoxin
MKGFLVLVAVLSAGYFGYTRRYQLRRAIRGESPVAVQAQFYSIPGCVQCKRMREWLKQRDVSFTEHDVSTNSSVLLELGKICPQRVLPIVEMNGHCLVPPFDQGTADNLLEEVQAGAPAPVRG